MTTTCMAAEEMRPHGLIARTTALVRNLRERSPNNEELEYLRARLEGAEAMLVHTRTQIADLEQELLEAARAMESLNAELMLVQCLGDDA